MKRAGKGEGKNKYTKITILIIILILLLSLLAIVISNKFKPALVILTPQLKDSLVLYYNVDNLTSVKLPSVINLSQDKKIHLGQSWSEIIPRLGNKEIRTVLRYEKYTDNLNNINLYSQSIVFFCINAYVIRLSEWSPSHCAPFSLTHP